MSDQSNALILLDGVRFTKAKASANPHEYIVKGRDLPKNDFLRVGETIRAHGVDRVWGGKLYVVWYAPDGHHYWTMGWPKEITKIINRADSATSDQTTAPTPGKEYRYSGPDGLRPRW